ncbi:hypothetical protein SLS60_003228 [Paraconiothyrium brasiliense]|uniref:Uncharacterized protein n=1 Tax=Paraconiothyrium brasiliense TaxID=300254 RepID=A0ABR3RV34_9PLEO
MKAAVGRELTKAAEDLRASTAAATVCTFARFSATDMTLKYLSSEKEALLPVATMPPAAAPEAAADERAHATFESSLFYLCVATLLLLFGSLCYRNSIPPSSAFASSLQLLNAGMLSSLWAALPAPALLFLSAPYFVERPKVTMVRYWIYLLYIVGVAVGALVFGGQASALECELASG